MMKVALAYRLREKGAPYESALREVGLEAVSITPDAPRSLGGLDGLVLTGGTDVNPARYGQVRAEQTSDPDDARDELEARLLEEALDSGVPVLAICRGMQLFNVVQGGTLIQHLPPAGLHQVKPREADAHTVLVAPHTRLAGILGAGKHAVNSRHHQAVDRPGDGLVISAVSPDGVIEAIEKPGAPFVLAVQWHPEDRILTREDDRKLFLAFALEVARFSSPVSP